MTNALNTIYSTIDTLKNEYYNIANHYDDMCEWAKASYKIVCECERNAEVDDATMEEIYNKHDILMGLVNETEEELIKYKNTIRHLEDAYWEMRGI